MTKRFNLFLSVYLSIVLSKLKAGKVLYQIGKHSIFIQEPRYCG